MNPQQAYDLIRIGILRRPELRFKSWPNIPKEMPDIHPMQGGCYIATQVFCHLIKEARPYCSLDRFHFWAQIDDQIWDLTFDQFEYEFDYSCAALTRFKHLSKRAAELLFEVESLRELTEA